MLLKILSKSLKLGINTSGGEKMQVVDSFNLFIESKCYVLICPTKIMGRTSNSSVIFIRIITERI